MLYADVIGNQKMKFAIYIIVLLFLNSCYSIYDITVNKNGSAHVKVFDMTEENGENIEQSFAGEEFYGGFDNFAKSKIISNYRKSMENGFYNVEYDIENIDSLHLYLIPPEIEMDFKQTTFKYSDKTFTISQKFDENGPDEATMYAELLPVKITFRFQNKIKEFSSDLDFVTQTGKKEIEVSTNLRQLAYGSGTHEVVVKM